MFTSGFVRSSIPPRASTERPSPRRRIPRKRIRPGERTRSAPTSRSRTSPSSSLRRACRQPRETRVVFENLPERAVSAASVRMTSSLDFHSRKRIVPFWRIASRIRTSLPPPSPFGRASAIEEKLFVPSPKTSKTTCGSMSRTLGRSIRVSETCGIPRRLTSAAEKQGAARPRGSFATATSFTRNAGGTRARSKPPIVTLLFSASERSVSARRRIRSWKRAERKTA